MEELGLKQLHEHDTKYLARILKLAMFQNDDKAAIQANIIHEFIGNPERDLHSRCNSLVKKRGNKRCKLQNTPYCNRHRDKTVLCNLQQRKQEIVKTVCKTYNKDLLSIKGNPEFREFFKPCQSKEPSSTKALQEEFVKKMINNSKKNELITLYLKDGMLVDTATNKVYDLPNPVPNNPDE